MRPPRRAWPWVGLGLGLGCAGLWAVALLLALAASLASELAGQRSSAAVATDELRKTLGRVRDRVPPPAELADQSCPDAELLGAALPRVSTGLRGEARLHLRIVSYEALSEFVERGPTPLTLRPLGLLPTREELGFEPPPNTAPELSADWLWIEDLGLREAFHPNLYQGYYPEDSLRSTVADVLAGRHVGVLRASSRCLPRILNGGAPLDVLDRRRELRSGESFQPGAFQGGIGIMDLQTGGVVCRARIEARSSDAIGYRNRRAGLLWRQEPSRVLRDDFRDRFDGAVRGALERVSRLLEW